MSVKRMNYDRTEERSVKILYHTKDHVANFSEKKNGWWGQPHLPEILGQLSAVDAKSPIRS